MNRMDGLGTRKRTRRGSALIFSVVLITAITIMFISSQELMMTSVRAQSRYETRAKVLYASESAIASIVSELRHSIITLPSTRSITVANMPVTATVVDNGGVVPRTVQITTTVTLAGRTYSRVDVRGNRFAPSMWNFALFVDNSEVGAGVDFLTVGTLGSGGDTYYGFSSGGTDSHTINGDFECAGSVGGTFNVTGTKWTNAPSITFPSVVSANYLAAATTIFGGGEFKNYAFADLGPSTTEVIYKAGNLDVKGSFTGNGVVYCPGDMNLKDNITVTGGKLVLIARGDVNLTRDNSAIAAFVYAKGTFSSNNTGNTITGAVVCSDLNVRENCTILYDPYFWNTPSERVRFKLPGDWP